MTCAVAGCRNIRRLNRHFTYHRPRKHQIESWMTAIGRPPDFRKYSAIICSAHFKPTDIIKINERSYVKLGAVPSLNINSKVDGGPSNNGQDTRPCLEGTMEKFNEIQDDVENYWQYKLMNVRPRLKPGTVPNKFACQNRTDQLGKHNKRERTDFDEQMPGPSHHLPAEELLNEEIETEKEEELDNSTVSSGDLSDFNFRNDMIMNDGITIKMEFSAEDTEITYGEISNVFLNATDIGLTTFKEEPCDVEIKTEKADQRDDSILDVNFRNDMIMSDEIDIKIEPCDEEIITEKEEQLDNSAPSNSDIWDYKFKNDLSYEIKNEFSAEDTVITYGENDNAEKTNIGLTERGRELYNNRITIENSSCQDQDKAKKQELDISRHPRSVLKSNVFGQSSNLKKSDQDKAKKQELNISRPSRSVLISSAFGQSSKKIDQDKSKKQELDISMPSPSVLKNEVLCQSSNLKKIDQDKSKKQELEISRPSPSVLKKEVFGQSIKKISIAKERFTLLYTCALCNTHLSQTNSRIQHKKFHMTEKYNCDICEEGFTKKDELEKHVAQHRLEKRYKCDICQKTFLESSRLMTHRLYSKLYECEVCHKKFAYRNDLVAHITVHTVRIKKPTHSS